MRKALLSVGIVLGIGTGIISADPLKDSLSKMIHEKEEMPGMVDLSGLDRPSVSKVHKARPSNTIVAIVNGHKIRKKRADNYLKERTQGRVVDFDMLPKAQRKRLIKELALPMLIADRAKKELSAEEKEAIYVSTWMRKQASKVSVSDEEVYALYTQLKEKAMQRNGNNIIPPFESIKNKMKSQILEKKIMSGLMKNAKIEVALPVALPPMMLRNPINTIN